jgi:leader peptidase (prepilin peptidase) / N-methyltransferase
MLPLALRLAALFVVGAWLGSLVNWAIYTLAWNPRPISPWSPFEPRRTWFDRVPILGWFALRREAAAHGSWFWLRPLVLEVATGAAIAALYWWEVDQAAIVRGQIGAAIVPPAIPLHFQFISHALLLCLMLAASFIDIDEKIIPDEITVPGTVLGLGLATLVPMSLLPHVAERAVPSVVGVPLMNAVGGGQAAVANGGLLWLEPVTATAPNAWPTWAAAGDWRGLAIGLACYWLWCFALAPRIWRGRHSMRFALRLILARLSREFTRPPLRRFLLWGTAIIVFVWAIRAQSAWTGLLTALIGLAASGGIVWAVRLIGTAALRREAMGFGDVTLMMMIGTFLGWQACLILFFLAPFAGLAIGLLQFVLRRDDVIPYGPFLCLAAAVTVVGWAPIWHWARPLFGLGWLVPAVLIVCLVLLGLMLALWQLVKGALFGPRS